MQRKGSESKRAVEKERKGPRSEKKIENTGNCNKGPHFGLCALHRIEILHNFIQLLDAVFVISRITKVEVGVISRSQRLNLT